VLFSERGVQEMTSLERVNYFCVHITEDDLEWVRNVFFEMWMQEKLTKTEFGNAMKDLRSTRND